MLCIVLRGSSVVSTSSKRSMKFILSRAVFYHVFLLLKRHPEEVFENFFRIVIILALVFFLIK